MICNRITPPSSLLGNVPEETASPLSSLPQPRTPIRRSIVASRTPPPHTTFSAELRPIKSDSPPLSPTPNFHLGMPRLLSPVELEQQRLSSIGQSYTFPASPRTPANRIMRSNSVSNVYHTPNHSPGSHLRPTTPTYALLEHKAIDFRTGMSGHCALLSSKSHAPHPHPLHRPAVRMMGEHRGIGKSPRSSLWKTSSSFLRRSTSADSGDSTSTFISAATAAADRAGGCSRSPSILCSMTEDLSFS